jgi:hypothetical protein
MHVIRALYDRYTIDKMIWGRLANTTDTVSPSVPVLFSWVLSSMLEFTAPNPSEIIVSKVPDPSV